MSTLVLPHGGKLKPLLLKGEELNEARGKAKSLHQIRMTTRERDDLIMMGIGAFSPLEGFMGKADWKSVCDDMRMTSGIFWPIPITLSVTKEIAKGRLTGPPMPHGATMAKSPCAIQTKKQRPYLMPTPPNIFSCRQTTMPGT